MKNKITSLTIALLLGTALSFGQTWQIGSPNAADVTATLNNGTLTISGKGKMKDFKHYMQDPSPFAMKFSIKKVVVENGVTNIGEFAFHASMGVEDVSLPNSVETIGESAFDECDRLKVINFPKTLKTIGSNAFFHSALESITIVAGEIGSAAFNSCGSLRTIVLQADVKFISNSAFTECTALTSVTVNWSMPLSGIQPNIFNGVDLSKATLTVPAGTKEAYKKASVWNGFGAFVEVQAWQIGTPNLSDVVATLDNGTLTISGTGKIKDFDYSVPSYFTVSKSDIKKVVIEDGITHIGNLTFSSHTALEEVSIPASVATIGIQAFSGCTALTSVIVEWPTPLSITSIAFSGVKLPNATLTVPPGTKALYAAADVWKNFGTIIGTSTERIPASILIHSSGRNISIDTPSKEAIEIYSVSGALLYKGRKAAGAMDISLNNAEGVLLVKGSSGWTRKLFIK
jgi:hypothetical protein